VNAIGGNRDHPDITERVFEEEEREERLTGTVRPTRAGECSVSGRDERPRSSADALELLVGYGNRGWLKPPPPEEGLTEGMTRQEYGSRRLTGTVRPTLDVG